MHYGNNVPLLCIVQDEYFQVDNSAIKHDGFFVNRGKLERMWVSLIFFLDSGPFLKYNLSVA